MSAQASPPGLSPPLWAPLPSDGLVAGQNVQDLARSEGAFGKGAEKRCGTEQPRGLGGAAAGGAAASG
jgi:hypothetical protein